MSLFIPFPEDYGSALNQTIVPLVIADEEGYIIDTGTGFYISEYGLMITARHFIEDAERIIKQKKNDGIDARLFSMFVMNIKNKESLKSSLANVLLPVHRIWKDSGSDAILCHTEIPFYASNQNPIRLTLAKLNFSVPKIGNAILGLGYYQMAGGIHRLEISSAQSGGDIFQVDETLSLRYPSVYPWAYAACQFEDGMSGGPVFNDKLEVIGVISKGLAERLDGEIQDCARFALLNPLIDMEIEEPVIEMQNHEHIRKWKTTTLRKLIQEGIVLCDFLPNEDLIK